MPKTPAEVLKDPEFHGLPLGEQLTVMRSLDPEFAALPAKDQGTVIATAKQKFLGLDKIGEKPQDQGFISTIGKDIGNIPTAILHPIDTINAMGNAQHEQFQQGRDAFKRGDYVEAGGRTMAGALPVLGPIAATIGDEIGNGQYGQATAHTAELLFPKAVKEAPAALKSVPKVPYIATKLPGIGKAARVARDMQNGSDAATALARASAPAWMVQLYDTLGKKLGKTPDTPAGSVAVPMQDATETGEAVNGNTYPVRDKLREIGGTWDAQKKAWIVPKDSAAEAQRLVHDYQNANRRVVLGSDYASRSETVPSEHGVLPEVSRQKFIRQLDTPPSVAAKTAVTPAQATLTTSVPKLLAQSLRESGIDAERAKAITPEQWNSLAQNSEWGVHLTPQNIQAAIQELSGPQIRVRRR